MPTLGTYRNYSDHDVIQNFTFAPSGTYPVPKGTFVKVWSGVMTDQNLQMLGAVGAAWGNTVSQRYGIQPYVVRCDNSGDNALGMTLYDVKVTDENGELLIYHPDKAAQMQVTLSGRPLPIVTRGIFLYSGVSGTPLAGQKAYLASDGTIQSPPALSFDGGSTATRVGTFLGPKDANGFVYLKLNL